MSSNEISTAVDESTAPDPSGYGVEVAGYRDPDGEVTIQVFLNGERVEAPRVEIVDPGRGSPYPLSEWRQNSVEVGKVGGSPAWVLWMRRFYDDAEERYTTDDVAEHHLPYAEAEPLGPTDNGDAGGDAQLSTAYGRRFVRPLADGRFAVLDVECYVVNVETDSDKPARPVLSRTYGFTVCTDGADPTGTEEDSTTHEDDGIPYVIATPADADADAFRLCRNFDVSTADLRWTYALTGETVC